MGKSLKRIVFTVRNELQGFVESDDARLKKEIIEDMILDIRALLAKDVFTSDKFLGDEWYQICDGIEIKSKKSVMPSGFSETHPDIYSYVPALQSDVKWQNIKYLGSVDGKVNYTRLSYSGFLSTDGRMVTSDDPFYTVSGSKILYKNLPNIGQKYVRMIAVIYDPRNAQDFNDTLDFPMPDGQIHKAELICIKQLAAGLNVVVDNKNDANDVQTAQGGKR